MITGKLCNEIFMKFAPSLNFVKSLDCLPRRKLFSIYVAFIICISLKQRFKFCMK